MIGKPVLVLDQDPQVAQSLVLHLLGAGLFVNVAVTASAACLAARVKYFHSLVVIARQSEGPWEHHLQELRAVAPRTWLLVVTDLPTEQATTLCKITGIDRIVAEPVSIQSLLQHLRSLSVRRRPVEQELHEVAVR